MKFLAEINVMPLQALLDPQGKAVTGVIRHNGYTDMNHVRIGKRLTIEVEADTKEQAADRVDEVCRRILHNPIMEEYEFSVKQKE
ncbi:MAG: phosphoribosylformylglycinamidine synthase subunit PurS [Prevotellaceae bacterium]|jgi:phosphoribosylformylglycinamidine synthase|nr:phosphoribosylformylglycinamidine synthase subunit PurS [Prevotellaceae bacterium]